MRKARKATQGARASRIAVAVGRSKTDSTNGLRRVMLKRLGEQLVIFVESGLDG